MSALASDGLDLQDSVSREVALWRTVLMVAFDDATSRRPSPEQKEARQWLISNCRDFRAVCTFALLDADAVGERADKLARAGWPAQRTHRKEKAA